MAELGKLTAVFDADTHKFDAGVKGVESKVGGMSTAFRSLGSATSIMEGPLNGIAGRLSSVGTLAGSAAAPVGIFGLAILASAKASYELQKALFDLAMETAEFQGKFQDLAQQTGITTETLSAFEILARQTGGSLDSIVASLGIFQKHLEEATNPLSKAAEALDELGVNSLETETALRQTMAALAKMPEGFHQTALALELFGRGGKQVLAILKETGGDLDAAQAKFRAMGLEVSGPTAAAADKLNDSMVILDAQIRALKGSLGTMVMPHVLSTVERLTTLINDNKQAIGQLAFAVGVLASMFGDNLVTSLKVAAVGMAYLQSQLAPLVALMQFVKGFKGGTGDIPAQGLPGKVEVGGSGGVGAGIFRPKVGGVGGGRGGGGGGGGAMDGGAALLQQLSKEFFRLTEHTKLEEIQEQLLEKQFEKTSDKIKKRIMIVATEIDIQKKTLSLTRERYASEASYARFAEDEFIKSLTRVRALRDIERERFASKEGKNRPSWIDLGGGSTVGGEPGTTGRQRVATVEVQVMRERMQMIHEQMMGLGQDLTSIFSRSIGDGFDQGAKHGLVTLAQGLLQIVQDVFLKKLAEGLGNILSDAASGGGWLSKLLGIGIGAVGGGIGVGGGGVLGGTVPFLGGVFAEGGYLKPGQWGIAGERGPERIYGGQTGVTVMPNGGGQTVHNHYSINLPPAPKGGMVTRKSQRQQAEQLIAMLQGAQV